MPTRPPRLCPRCRELLHEPGDCPRCHPPFDGSTRPRTDNARQARARRQRFRDHPLCQWPGCQALASVDDHIVPWSQRGDMTYAQWDAAANHQVLCKPHHDQKTHAESRGRVGQPRPTAGPPPF